MQNECFKNASVSVLGGGGFIGEALVRRLSGMAGVLRVIDKSVDYRKYQQLQNLEVYEGDVRDPSKIGPAVKNCSIVFNLVGQGGHLESMANPHQDLDNNVCAQLTILEACKTHAPGAHVIFASTRQIYGVPECLPVPEDHPVNPVDINGINKLTAERYHLLHAQMCTLRATVLRLTNTYGPGMRTSGPNSTFLGTWIRQILDGQPISIFGDGSNVRDMTHVEDVVNAFLKAAEDPLKTNKDVFNIGSGIPTTLREIADSLVSLSPSLTRIQFLPFPQPLKEIDIGSYVSDISKFTNRTAWTPQISLHDGLRTTLNSFGLLEGRPS